MVFIKRYVVRSD